jgi:hypothetical protein
MKQTNVSAVSRFRPHLAKSKAKGDRGALRGLEVHRFQLRKNHADENHAGIGAGSGQSCFPFWEG